MNQYSNFYGGAPTAGLKDGIPVTSDGSSPLQFGVLNVTTNEESLPLKVAIRCISNVKTTAPTILSMVGANSDKYCFALDNAGSPGVWQSYGTMLIVADTITDVNTVFWMKARASMEESPVLDKSTYISAKATYSVNE